jgi:hypothetical protein
MFVHPRIKEWLYAGVAVALWALGHPACGTANTGGGYVGPVPDAGDGGDNVIGMPCTRDMECGDNGVCLTLSGFNTTYSICSKPCVTNADCGDRSCGIAGDGSSMCMPACPPNTDAFVCIDGVPTACSAADGTQCDWCGCPADLRCEPGTGCVARRGFGELCDSDGDCNTDNCGKFTGTCQVPIGQQCSPDNCDLCWTSASWSYCSRECDSDQDCNGGLCLGNFDQGYMCRPPCTGTSDPTCPGQCRYSQAAAVSYCDCTDCAILQGLRPLGAPCSGDSLCTSGECYSHGSGVCSKACTSSAECGEGFTCVDVPCLAGEVDTCGRKCVRPCGVDSVCPAGYCRALASTEGLVLDVCDAKLPDGRGCSANVDCQSGICDARCIPVDGWPNGGSCIGPDDGCGSIRAARGSA